MAGLAINFDHAAFDQFRRQPELTETLTQRGRAIANAAGGEPDFAVIQQLTKSRTRVVVITATAAAQNAEASSRALTKALDAGRG